MANYNKVILVGNLTRDPQLRYLPSQTPVTEFGLAVNRRWTGGDGQKKEETCFIDCHAFGKQAETINHYMAKGQQILVEGRLQFQQWQSQDGKKMSKHTVVVEAFQFMGGPAAGREQDPAAAARPPIRTQYPGRHEPTDEIPQDNMPTEDVPPPQAKEDDIPF